MWRGLLVLQCYTVLSKGCAMTLPTTTALELEEKGYADIIEAAA